MSVDSDKNLRESADLFRAVFSLAPVGIAQIGPDGRWLRINAKLCRIVGYTADELQNLSIQELTHPDDMEEHLQHIHRLISGEIDNYSMEKRYFHKNGSIVHVNLAVSLVRDPAGAPEYFIAVVEDITARKMAEETMRESEALFRIIFDQAFQMMGLMKPDGTLITINRTAAEFIKTKQPGKIAKGISMRTWEAYFTSTEQKGEALLDKPFWELPWWADSPELQECLRGAVQTASRGEAVRCEAHFQTAGGKTRWVDLSLTPMKDDSGNVVLLVPEARDITENKLAEQAVRDGERFKQGILDSLPAHIAVLDKGGIVMMANRSWLRFAEENGLPDLRAVSVGADYLAVCRRAADMADPLAREGLEGIGAVLNGRQSEFILEYPCHSPTQQRWFVMNVIRPGHDLQGAVITHLDITDRKRWEHEIANLNRHLAARASELEAANQEMETFGYSLTHDLRKPLTIINGYCQIILDMYGDTLDEQCKTYLAEIYNGSLRMNQLIDALLKFSVLTRGELRRERVDLSDMAKTVAAELRRTETGREVSFNIAEGITVDADRSLLQIVMDNLLGNAWKYTSNEQQAVIEFGVREMEGVSTYFVRDNGAGFNMSDAEKLFVPFQRLPGTDQFKGHGIGLATVARVIQRHGGRVWAEGEPGKGATFYFTLST